MSRSPSASLLLAGLALASLSLATPASAVVTQGEQVNRGTGAAGTGAFAGTVSIPRFIADDGRLSYFDHDVRGAVRRSQTAEERAASGAYVRDVVANTTTQLASGNVKTTGLTADGTTLSLVTSDGLTASDTDVSGDLYTVNVATRVITLVATGDLAVTSGAITADGKAVVWTDASGTYRRPLAAGAATRLTTLGVPIPIQGLLNRRNISADGQVASVLDRQGINLIVRPGKAPVPVEPGPAPRGEVYLAAVSPDGLTAVATADGGLRVITVPTGAIKQVVTKPALDTTTSPAVSAGASTAVVDSPGGPVVVRYATGSAVPVVDPATEPLGLYFRAYVVSGNARYTLTGRSFSAGDGALRYLFAEGTGAATLPGTLDPPSPVAAYLDLDPGCTNGGVFAPAQRPFVHGTFTADLAAGRPAATSITVAIKNRATGAVIRSATLTPGPTSSILQDIPMGWSGNWILDAAVKLADGRTLTERWTQGPYSGTSKCQSVGF